MNVNQRFMKTARVDPSSTCLVCLALLFVAAWPEPVWSYEMSWSTIDCGGGTSRAGSLEVHGTIGQPEAGYCGNSRYGLVGGFWPSSLGFGAALASIAAEPLTALSGPCLLPWTCIRVAILSAPLKRIAERQTGPHIRELASQMEIP